MTASYGLTSIALMALICAFWRLGCELNWIGEFAVTQGLFSHWQVWLAMAMLLQILASVLERYARDGGPAIP